jgi:hypothetical protein
MRQTRPSQYELQNQFYEWTLKEARKAGVGQDVFYFRHMREYYAKFDNRCECGDKISPFEVRCAGCILDGLKKAKNFS